MVTSALAAHDLFLRPREYLVKAGSTFDVRVLNGTFNSSENPVAPERLRDLSLVGPDGRSHPDRAGWTGAGKESSWRVSVGEPGTYVIAASLAPKTIRLHGAQFNAYLAEEGLPDVLEQRRVARTLGDSAHERYAKHVKALVRVGNGATSREAHADTAYRLVLGYPAELVPLDNPYRRARGAAFRVLALVDGQPASSQLVLYGGRTPEGARIAERRVRTDSTGLARLPIARRGTWYAKFIRMRPVSASAGDSVNYESKWATLTFAVP